MKKVALASIIAAFLSLSAHAQSNVTVYGIADIGYQKYDTGAGSLTRANNNGWVPSRLGFKGTEDLGSGLKANFQLEGLLALSSGTLGNSTTNQVFNREAWVGLSGNFGEVRVGRQDVTDASNVEALVSQSGNFGSMGINGTTVESGIDQANVVRYHTPTVKGFTVQVAYASNNSAATTDSNTDQRAVLAKYESGALTVYAGYHKDDGATQVAEKDFKVYGAKYDFGFASVGLTHGEGDNSTTATVKSKSTVASVRVPLAQGYAVHGAYNVAKDGNQSTDNKGTGYTLAVTKALSKRTSLYGAYSETSNQANSAMSIQGATTVGTRGLDTKAYTLGMVHSF